jgi:hypothetical protein
MINCFQALLSSFAFKLCFQFQFTPLHLGGGERDAGIASLGREATAMGFEAGAYTRPLVSST